MPVTRKHSDACLFAHDTRHGCVVRNTEEQLERVAPLAEKDGVALTTRREQRLATYSMRAAGLELSLPVYYSSVAVQPETLSGTTHQQLAVGQCWPGSTIAQRYRSSVEVTPQKYKG